MQRYTRYKVTRLPKRSGSVFYWICICLGLLLMAWLWRESQKEAESHAPIKPPSARFEPQDSAEAKTLVVRTSLPPPLPPIPAVPATASVWTVPRNVFEAQVALVRQGISPGSLDGVFGSQTRSALLAFQEKEHLSPTGELDAASKARLSFLGSSLTTYTLTSNDFSRLQPLGKSWLAKSEQERLDYETILELVAEKGQAQSSLVRLLNPALAWTNWGSGTTVTIPNTQWPETRAKAAFIMIRLAYRTLQAFDADTNLLAYFPCSIAKRMEKRPAGQMQVTVIVENPDYVFDPEVFPESEEGRQLGRRLVLPPGPNNPVGTVWIGLDKPGYGIHGTPKPEDVGRTESHGCFRLANWNAEHLLRLAWVGMPVRIEP